MDDTVKLTYRFVYIPEQDGYLGIAWDYKEGLLVSTQSTLSSYSVAKQDLETKVYSRGARLHYFDGEYILAEDGETILPRED